MNWIQIALLAVIQGVTELLPVSSSAHVIVAEKMMGLDPSLPEMTFLLVMLHTGTMLSVLIYFWPSWKKLRFEFLKKAIGATAFTGVFGLGLKVFIEKVVLGKILGESHGEIESLFKSLPLISCSLLCAGILISYAGMKEKKSGKGDISQRATIWIGIVQGLCLPFRGFSRSGATISVGLLNGVSRKLAEDFSFALAVLLTPPVIVLELHRLIKATAANGQSLSSLSDFLFPAAFGMVLSFGAGLLALRWLSDWLNNNRWKYFGFYCISASIAVFLLSVLT